MVADDGDDTDVREDVDGRRERTALPPESSSAEEAGCERRHLQPHKRPSLGYKVSQTCASGWLYIQVATRTTVEPRMKVTVIWKLNSATEARNEITMLKLVAKPLRMLSAYLITRAVRRPPRT